MKIQLQEEEWKLCHIHCRYRRELRRREVMKKRKRKQSKLGKETTMVQVSNLPDDLKGEILLRLPIMALAKFRYVIRDYSRLHYPKFFNILLNRQIELDKGSTIIITTATRMYKVDIGAFNSPAVNLEFPFPNTKSSESIVLVGSCNGLLLCSTHKSLFYGRIVYLWNPVTGDCMQLPPHSHDMTLETKVVLGFGYDHNSCKFKVVLVSHSTNKRTGLPKVEASVYTLGTSSWRSIEQVQYPLWKAKSTRVFGGCPHWIMPNMKLIVLFDVRKEKFKEIPLPVFDNSSTIVVDLAALGDHLSIFTRVPDLEQRFELWVRMDNELENAWTKQLFFRSSDLPTSLSYERGVRIHPSMLQFYGIKNGQVLSWSRGGPALYDLETRCVRKWSLPGHPRFFSVYSYTESLAMVSMEDTRMFIRTH